MPTESLREVCPTTLAGQPKTESKVALRATALLVLLTRTADMRVRPMTTMGRAASQKWNNDGHFGASFQVVDDDGVVDERLVDVRVVDVDVVCLPS